MRSPQCRCELEFDGLTLYCLMRKNHKGEHRYDEPGLERMLEKINTRRAELTQEVTKLHDLAVTVVQSLTRSTP